MTVLSAKGSGFRAYNRFNGADVTVGAKQTNTIRVGVQLREAANNKKPAARCNVRCFLASDAAGSIITPTVPTSNVAVGTAGAIVTNDVTNKMFTVMTDATGFFDLDIVQTAGGTSYYLVVFLPDGGNVVSGVIAF